MYYIVLLESKDWTDIFLISKEEWLDKAAVAAKGSYNGMSIDNFTVVSSRALSQPPLVLRESSKRVFDNLYLNGLETLRKFNAEKTKEMSESRLQFLVWRDRDTFEMQAFDNVGDLGKALKKKASANDVIVYYQKEVANGKPLMNILLLKGDQQDLEQQLNHADTTFYSAISQYFKANKETGSDTIASTLWKRVKDV